MRKLRLTGKNGGWLARYEVPRHFAPGLHRAYLSTPGDRQFLPSRTDFVINAVKPRHSEQGGTPGSGFVKE